MFSTVSIIVLIVIFLIILHYVFRSLRIYRIFAEDMINNIEHIPITEGTYIENVPENALIIDIVE